MSIEVQDASSDKIIVVGIDGFEPSLAKKFMEEGKMPNLQSFVKQGACREDLVLLGGFCQNIKTSAQHKAIRTS